MRLLNSQSKQLELLHRTPARYAIVSHRWGAELEEVLFTDIGDHARTQSKGKGYEKILGACNQASKDGLDYVWLDTCCIDKSNSTELSEAINSMYKWYQKSDVCYAYLHDVSEASRFTESDWFTRGWTLQELIAPKRLIFFTKDWKLIGTREELIDRIAERTGIDPEILRSGKIPPEVTISQKMVWAADRGTTKVEDRAYSMLGILGVSMVPLYGIDEGAFEDLQHKIIAKSPDQTLFAWHHTVVPSEDVEMADEIPASEPAPQPTLALTSAPAPALPPVPASGTTTESASQAPVPESAAEGDIGTASQNTTGLLASSPDRFLKSYEISEADFRKNYVDGIRDHSYRSHFSLSNNLVHISLPIKHFEGKIWKAVLRCSLEPPDREQIQRPLVIYLEEVQPWKYVRIHLPRQEDEAEAAEGVQTNEVKDVPGSLEQLGDAESKLEGYMLRDIDVVGIHGERPPEGQQQRPFSEDPDVLPEPSEEERIAALPQHPPGVKTTNIIVCGEPGVAAGRVINLIIGNTIIKPLTDYDREAMAVTPIDATLQPKDVTLQFKDATLQSRNIRIFYIIGPRDPYLDLDIYHTAIRNMYQFVQRVKESGGIHLVLLCMVGSKVTGAVESNYRMFHDYICQKQVPTMLIVTGLGKTKRMEDWWDKHKDDRELKAMNFINHACITVLQGEDREHEKKYDDSVQTLRRLVTEFMEDLERTHKVGYRPDDIDRWFVYMGKRAMDLLLLGQKKTIKQEAVMKTLKEAKAWREVHKKEGPKKEWINLTEEEANSLARQFFDEHAMEL